MNPETECGWRYDPQDFAMHPEGNHWATSCGELHEFFDGTPRDNGHRYCPYCGRTIHVTQNP